MKFLLVLLVFVKSPTTTFRTDLFLVVASEVKLVVYVVITVFFRKSNDLIRRNVTVDLRSQERPLSLLIIVVIVGVTRSGYYTRHYFGSSSPSIVSHSLLVSGASTLVKS